MGMVCIVLNEAKCAYIISKEDFLGAPFLKEFKEARDFASFMNKLFGRGTEMMLEAGMDVGYEKYAPEGGNSPNGKTSKNLKSK
jgi:putative transposase